MKTDRMIFGENVRVSMDSSATGVNNNVLVVGSTGCGKTMSISEPQLLETEHNSLIVTLTKRKLVDKYRKTLKKKGYEVEELNFVEPALGTVSFDPMRFVKSEKDIRSLAESIVQTAHGTSADPYWAEAARELLCAETDMTMRKAVKRGEAATFADVLNYHLGLEIESGRGDFAATSFDLEFNFLKEFEPTCLAVRCWKSVKGLPRKTLSCIIGTLNPALEEMVSDELRNVMKTRKPVDVARMAKKKTVLFVVTSPVSKCANKYVNLFYTCVFRTLFELAESQPDGKLPIPVHMICDDFATGAPVPNFAEYISIFREKQMSVTLLIQSESQLGGMYGPADAKTIINNCDTYVYMGGMDLETCASLSTRLNIPIEDVMYMPVGQVCVMRRGQAPKITQRYRTAEDPRYKALSEERETGAAR